MSSTTNMFKLSFLPLTLHLGLQSLHHNPHPSCQAVHVAFSTVAYLSTLALESLRFSRPGHSLGLHMPESNGRENSPCNQALTYFLITPPVFQAT